MSNMHSTATTRSSRKGGDHGEVGVRFGSEIFMDEDGALLVENVHVD